MELLCDLIIPILAVLLIIASGLQPRPGAVWAAVGASLAWVYLFHFGDRWLGVWEGLGLDFSTHTGVAIAVGTSLGVLGREWSAATLALWCLYAVLMVRLGYHTLPDILTTAGAILPGALLAQLLVRKRSTVVE
ncbi:MAG: hypothetical protein ACYTGZ_08000 [Planctomycetota bacterium]